MSVAQQAVCDLLGEWRSIDHVFDDGRTYICPFCQTPQESACSNPGCTANPGHTVEQAEQIRQSHLQFEQEKADREKRMRLHSLSFEERKATK